MKCKYSSLASANSGAKKTWTTGQLTPALVSDKNWTVGDNEMEPNQFRTLERSASWRKIPFRLLVHQAVTNAKKNRIHAFANAFSSEQFCQFEVRCYFIFRCGHIFHLALSRPHLLCLVALFYSVWLHPHQISGHTCECFIVFLNMSLELTSTFSSRSRVPSFVLVWLQQHRISIRARECLIRFYFSGGKSLALCASPCRSSSAARERLIQLLATVQISSRSRFDCLARFYFAVVPGLICVSTRDLMNGPNGANLSFVRVCLILLSFVLCASPECGMWPPIQCVWSCMSSKTREICLFCRLVNAK